MSTHKAQHTFLWKIVVNDPLTISKYPPYLFYWIIRAIISGIHLFLHFFMPPTSKKLWEHIGFGLCVHPFVKKRSC